MQILENPDLSIELFGRTLANPTILASGILGTTRDLLRTVARHGAGAVTVKSISVDARKGHPNPTVLAWGPGLINAVGYSNPGVEKAVAEFSNLEAVGCPVIGSVIGTCTDDFRRVVTALDHVGFAALEVPLSCPHTPGYGRIGKQDTPDAVFEIVSAICSCTSKPLLVKLPPAASDLIEMALAAKAAGAYGITAVNTIGPGMLIDVDTGKPCLGFGIGGLSGPALRPLAVAAVFQLFKAVDLPIVGTGGITTGRDAIEMIMAGATAVGIGSAVLSRGPSVFSSIVDEMRHILIERGASSVRELRGLSHE